MMSVIWVCVFLFALAVLFFNGASLVVFSIAYAVLLLLATLLLPPSLGLLVVLWVILLLIFIPLLVTPCRRAGLSALVLRFFRQSMPSMSTTEREALSAGDVVWVKELFSGRPHWETLAAYPIHQLSEDDRAFLEGPVEQLCSMINEWEHSRQHSIPDAIWDYLKKERFFGLIIPKEYGGRQLSATAISATLMTVAGLCRDIASCIAVPNSLGPGELLLQYGTQEQKSYYLPRLATGEEVPCFALTSPVAGSDAGAIQDHGVVCRAVFDGKEQTCVRLNWNKRYITLAPVATLLGLAFKLYDPDHILGHEEQIGITCALIPVSTQGVSIGRRHLPLNASFPNGPTQGCDVIIPIDWVIGGRPRCGQGWKMLMECLAAGRSISLPSIGIGVAKLGVLTSSAYAQIRQQFNTPIGNFGGIQERLTEMTGLTYLMNATELMTTGIIDGGAHPVVASGIVKSYITELSRVVLNHSMDVHAGKGICMGPNNYLGSAYMAAPISITVEGANILTRSMIIFGQGLIRAHPYVLKELQAAENEDHALRDSKHLIGLL